MNHKRTRRAFTGKLLPAAGFFAWCCLACAPFPARAAFEDLGAGARGPGLGNAMVSVAEDVYAAHYNPAGLGVLTRPQFTAAYTQLFPNLTDGSKLGTSFFGYAHPLREGRQGTLAGTLNLFSLDGGLYRETTAALSYGRLAWSRPGGGELFLGASLKGLYSSFGSFAESASATDGVINTGLRDPVLGGSSGHSALDADAGALYRFPGNYQLGLQLAHLARPDMAFSSSDSDPLPLAVKLGLNYKSLISNLAAQAETTRAPDGSADHRVTAAAERWFPKTFIGDFGVRGALGLGSREYKQISMGFSYRTRRVQVDYGYSLPLGGIEDTGGSHRMALTFSFGKPTEDEETLEMLMEAMGRLKAGAASAAPARVETNAVTAYVKPQPSKGEREIAEKLARAEEAIKAGRYREAVVLANKVLETAPGSAAAWQNLGIAYLGLGKHKSSLYAWEKAYENEKSPALKEAIKGYMRSIQRLARSAPQAKPAPAAAPAARRPSLDRGQIKKLLDLGVDHYVNGELDRAEEAFARVLDADPDNIEALKALRRLKDEKGN